MIVLQVILYFLIPLLLEAIAVRIPVIRKIGVVTLCYILGLITGNIPGPLIDTEVASTLIDGVVALAIPLLLFKTDFMLIKTTGRNMLIAFGCCVLAVLLASLCVTPLFSNALEVPWVAGGMITGVYTGGTLNMSAIGVALNAESEMFVVMNAADMLFGGIILLFLLTVARKLVGTFLGPNPVRVQSAYRASVEDKLDVRETPLAILYALFIVAGAIGSSIALFDEMQAVYVLLIISALGIVASSLPYIRNLSGGYTSGNYLLYVFCVAVGSLANLDVILISGPAVLLYFGVVLCVTLGVFALLAYMFGVDADSAIIAASAGLYGPAFIPPIARATNSMYLVPLGIALSLVGFAVGNFLGVGVARLLEHFLSVN